MAVNVALLGAGRIGKVHAKAVGAAAGATLVAVADAFPEAAETLAAAYGARVSTIDEIAAAGDVDAVIICTPTDTHADLIEKFARAGKAIFCEKPVDLSLDRVKACLKTVEDLGATLMLGFNRRFDPHFRAVRAAIDEGRIGDVEMVQITSRDPGAPPPSYITSSGGIFRDMTIHDFDMARFLLGDEVTTVYATASVLVDPEIGKLGDYDSAMVVLTTASGKQCSISNSRRATYGYDQRIEVHCSKGVVSAENQRPVSIEVATEAGYTRPPLHDFFMTRYTEAYAAEITAFVEAIETGSAPSPSGEDGLKALALAEAALKSIAERRAVGMDEV
ncbi:Inositol 2-dehydrogenase [Labrenzia sp. THAF191b]|uniref:inositol 2-dehydrogenase n=1 Tax=unclassified Labrenzia TaxID=2648686 RepID=UPI0012687327|nr:MULTISPECIES: inositol 2-dehydrogenase [unclassified Labrenzia]QFS98058.1 Inositol 2-dehydrogenase [Labrenzia sp. THAF191b]QFT04372.1 Inositol 2-dehydrogenase [Labrenzia sp. THAF191a]QFT15916.1 Inositol 2-dehydrogenase [Labrenzia sp. THAF187b]